MGYGTVNVGYPVKIGKPGGSDAYGSAAAVQTNLNSHTNNKNNPHGVTAAQIGAVPTSRTVNGKLLSSNITLSASDVGADTTGSASAALASAKSYTDTLIGNINSVLDAINGEVI